MRLLPNVLPHVCAANRFPLSIHGITDMPHCEYSHLIEINEKDRLLVIYRVNGSKRDLYTSVKLPDISMDNNPKELNEFCQRLGENIVLDSPPARRLFGI